MVLERRPETKMQLVKVSLSQAAQSDSQLVKQYHSAW